MNFTSQNALDFHRDTPNHKAKSLETNNVCKICLKKFDSDSEFDKHKQLFENQPKICNMCPFSACTMSALMAHKKNFHRSTEESKTSEKSPLEILEENSNISKLTAL